MMWLEMRRLVHVPARDACSYMLRRSLPRCGVAQSICKQAAALRFILEAPELEIGADERVTIPVLNDSPGQYRRVCTSASFCVCCAQPAFLTSCHPPSALEQ